MIARPHVFAVAILLLAAALRFIHLADFPSGINQDEADRAYEAYSLLQTGHDQHGHRWPLTLEAFSRTNDNASAIQAYAALPFVALLGPGVLASRLPAAIAGVALVWAVIALGHRLTGQWSVALLAGFALAVSPWHLTLSRLGHEAVWLPTLFVLGLLAYLSALDRRPWLLPLAVLAWGIGFYGYGPGKLFFPLAGLITVGLTFRRLRWRHPATAMAGVLVIAFGILLWKFSWAQLGAGHFNEVSIFHEGLLPGLRTLALNFLVYINPVTWVRGMLSVGPGDSLLVLFGIPAFFLLLPVSQQQYRLRWLLGLTLLLGILPAALTDANPSPFRAVGILALLQLTGAWGVMLFAKRFLWKLPRAAWQPLLLSLATLASVVGLVVYWQPPPAVRLTEDTRLAYTPAFNRVFTTLTGPLGQAREVRIADDYLNQPQITIMLLTPWDPATLARDHQFVVTDSGWYRTVRLGRYVFCERTECPTDAPGVAFVEISDQTHMGTRLVDRLPIRGFAEPFRWTISIND